MSNETRKVALIVWGGLASVILLIFIAFAASVLKEKSTGKPLPVLKQLPDFALTNQLGKLVSLDNLRGNVWLGNIIFTRCPGPCARMSKQFSHLQSQTESLENFRLISLTADPEFDTAEVLTKYGERFGANPGRWWFLTGPKRDIYNFATTGLMLGVQETNPAERTSDDDLFIHSTLFVLVDQKANVRAIYESSETNIEERITADIRKLLKK